MILTREQLDKMKGYCSEEFDIQDTSDLIDTLTAAWAENEAQHLQENKQLKGRLHDYEGIMSNMGAENEQLKTTVAVMRNALEWIYEDNKRFKNIPSIDSFVMKRCKQALSTTAARTTQTT